MRKNTYRYTLFGIGFGFCFPVLAILLDILVFNKLALTWQNIQAIHWANPLHFIIDTAPFFLGLAFGIAGSFLDKLTITNQSLEKIVDKRTKELKYANLELLQSEEDLRESRRKLQAIIDSTSDANFLVGNDYKIISFNKTAESLSKIFYHKTVQLDDNFWDYVMPEAEDYFREIFAAALQGEIMIRETQIRFPNEANLWLNLEFHPVRDENQKITAVSVNATDISQRKAAELHVANQNRELRQIAWLQSHEMRRLVANVIGLISLLEKEILSPDNQEIIFFLEKEIKSLDAVIHKIVKSINETEI
ncbi:MAG: PAS domain S-box protein [Microscillaceae bacterium]|nr:PAS domain S-box protein [Microscillaceae bacterium]